MKLKIMTWNVENFFQPGDDGPTTAAAYKAKLATLAAAIKKLDPDVIGLQEIGSPESFADLKKAVRRYPYGVLSEKPDARGIRVGFLSKRPLSSPETIADFGVNRCLAIRDVDGKPVKAMRRGALWVRTEVGGLVVNVVTAHLKSKLLSYPAPGGGTAFSTRDENLRARVASLALAERTAEAVTLRMRANDILKKHPKEGLVVLGDLNDGPGAATTQILQGPDGSQPDTGGFDRPDSEDRERLFNLAGLIPLYRRFSRITSGNRELIDHILVSEELLPRLKNGKRKVPGVDTHAELQAALESVGANPRARKDKPASDHAPVMAVFG